MPTLKFFEPASQENFEEEKNMRKRVEIGKMGERGGYWQKRVLFSTKGIQIVE